MQVEQNYKQCLKIAVSNVYKNQTKTGIYQFLYKNVFLIAFEAYVFVL